MSGTVAVNIAELKRVIAELGWSPNKLASKTGLDPQTVRVNLLQKGRVRAETYRQLMEELHSAANTLGVSIPESLLVTKTTSSEQDVGDGSIAVRVTVMEFCIKVDGDPDKFTPDYVHAFVEALGAKVQRTLIPNRIVRGSIKVYVNLTKEEAAEIERAIRAGEFQDFGNVAIESAKPDLQSRTSPKRIETDANVTITSIHTHPESFQQRTSFDADSRTGSIKENFSGMPTFSWSM